MLIQVQNLKSVCAGEQPVHIWKLKNLEGFELTGLKVNVLREDVLDHFDLQSY